MLCSLSLGHSLVSPSLLSLFFREHPIGKQNTAVYVPLPSRIGRYSIDSAIHQVVHILAGINHVLDVIMGCECSSGVIYCVHTRRTISACEVAHVGARTLRGHDLLDFRQSAAPLNNHVGSKYCADMRF